MCLQPDACHVFIVSGIFGHDDCVYCLVPDRFGLIANFFKKTIKITIDKPRCFFEYGSLS